jgi:hypothetical protein
MRKIFRRIAWSLSALTMLSTSLLLPAAAQTNNEGQAASGYQISPVRSEFTIEKGKSDTLTISIQNPSDVATSARAVVNNFVASEDENGTPRLILAEDAEPPKNNFKTLISEISDVQLGGKERKDVPVRITIPADANSGGYYGAIRFVPVNQTQESTVGLTASVGTIVLITVPGDLKQQLDMVQLSAAQGEKAKSFISSGEVDVMTRLRNSGDIHLKPFGRVTVKNMLGKTVSSYEFNNTEPRANILPGSTRRFNDKIGALKLPGRYTIESNLGYSSGGGELLSAKSSFWYLPVWAILILVALVAALAGAIVWLSRKFGSGTSKTKK